MPFITRSTKSISEASSCVLSVSDITNINNYSVMNKCMAVLLMAHETDWNHLCPYFAKMITMAN